MKALVLGAGGIVGQTMMTDKPDDIEAVFIKRTTSHGMFGVDLIDHDAVNALIENTHPDVIVNLAGENNVDVVEKDPSFYEAINIGLPRYLTLHHPEVALLQVSTQAVFGGDKAPYSADDRLDPINKYGEQKALAEAIVRGGSDWSIARLTFVLGVRPFQDLGRKNPLEDMLEKDHQLQVNDRFFSPVFAKDAADILWTKARALANGDGVGVVDNIGQPLKLSRFDIAAQLVWATEYIHRPKIVPVSHEYFPGLAARAENTQWAQGSLYKTDLTPGLFDCYIEWNRKCN